VLECVVNLSEGADRSLVDTLAATVGSSLLDVHSDPDHNRSVFTLAGADVEAAVRALATAALQSLDLRTHCGVHPRLGVVDVVPFVPLAADGTPARPGDDLGEALAARGRFARWAGAELALPCFLYGPERSLPEVRRHAFGELTPDTGPRRPHPSAGACAVGARPALVAYNVWLDTDDVRVAAAVAAAVRAPLVRTLGLAVAGGTQVSCNLLDPWTWGPAQVYDAVRGQAAQRGLLVSRAELVGLAPRQVVEAVAPERRRILDLSLDRSIEGRLAAGGAEDGG
jgi:glutamate formiminotransferase